jgi:hypothetical protein
MREFRIEELDIPTLSEGDVASFAALTNALQAEEDPEEPPRTVEAVARSLRVPRASGADNRDIVARDPQGILVGHRGTLDRIHRGCCPDGVSLDQPKCNDPRSPACSATPEPATGGR